MLHVLSLTHTVPTVSVILVRIWLQDGTDLSKVLVLDWSRHRRVPVPVAPRIQDGSTVVYHPRWERHRPELVASTTVVPYVIHLGQSARFLSLIVIHSMSSTWHRWAAVTCDIAQQPELTVNWNLHPWIFTHSFFFSFTLNFLLDWINKRTIVKTTSPSKRSENHR